MREFGEAAQQVQGTAEAHANQAKSLATAIKTRADLTYQKDRITFDGHVHNATEFVKKAKENAENQARQARSSLQRVMDNAVAEVGRKAEAAREAAEGHAQSAATHIRDAWLDAEKQIQQAQLNASYIF